MTTFNTLNKTEARAACKKAGISYTNMTVADMRAALEAHYADKPLSNSEVLNEAPAVEAQPAEPVVTTVEPEVSEQRTDAPQAPEAAAPAAEAPKPKRQPPVKEKNPDNKNGVSRPAAGNKCSAVWNACDVLHGSNTKITKAALFELIAQPGFSMSTIQTQWSRWRQYMGLTKTKE